MSDLFPWSGNPFLLDGASLYHYSVVGGSTLFWEPGETFGITGVENKKVSLPFFDCIPDAVDFDLVLEGNSLFSTSPTRLAERFFRPPTPRRKAGVELGR